MKKILGLLILGMFGSGQVFAGIIAGDICQLYQVNATGYGNANDCIGLLEKSKGKGSPKSSPGFLNNQQLFDDGTVIWDADGAFGHNDWEFLGKDEQSSQTFINATSGAPATWAVDSTLWGTFSITIKQGKETGYWYFDDLAGVTAGELFINDIFGDGTTNDGWSNVAIFGTSGSSVPEPSVIALFGLGLVGLGLVNRRRKQA